MAGVMMTFVGKALEILKKVIMMVTTATTMVMDR
jgi:hypothetical protein